MIMYNRHWAVLCCVFLHGCLCNEAEALRDTAKHVQQTQVRKNMNKTCTMRTTTYPKQQCRIYHFGFSKPKKTALIGFQQRKVVTSVCEKWKAMQTENARGGCSWGCLEPHKHICPNMKGYCWTATQWWWSTIAPLSLRHQWVDKVIVFRMSHLLPSCIMSPNVLSTTWCFTKRTQFPSS